MKARYFSSLLLLLLASCEPSGGPLPDAGEPVLSARNFHVAGKLEAAKLDEASGMQAITGGHYLVHNDEGKTLFLIDGEGRDLGRIKVEGAKNRDWEDITRVPGPEGPLIVVGDIGDNHKARKHVRLYFVPEPVPSPGDGRYPANTAVRHRLDVRFPDGPRDSESMAYDAHSDMILLLSKRDRPPRLYGVPLQRALTEQSLEAVFLTEVPGFRPPTRRDLLTSPHRGQWVSMPTAMDISADARLAAVLTYRSLYLCQRMEDESWAEAFKRDPEEFVGPPGLHDEAVAFSHDQGSVMVTTERRPAPIYRLDL
jgi:hypothetical protein